ncbi:BCLAF1 and THRAP3 family member 3 isoform X2 [Hypomesus transpacificus]|uniref:BCLAF1 and THRAP3 family member 3 isoform X2 n=1 Tax=Hypomesus transpacificus TaxID=137520 RepID=UPI001F07A01D|nr:BCLAF1 and THRAP3 family member 3 isoform X2 [Hypomesus transpacificus]
MSRPKSPQYLHRMSPRRHEGRGGRSQPFPWDDPDFDPQRVQVDLKRVPWKEIPEDRRERFTEDIHPEARRRPPLSPDHHRPGHPPNLRLKEYHRRTLSPSHELGYAQSRRLSPKHELDHEEGDDRGRDGFREDCGRFEGRDPSSHSPQRIPRERLPSVAVSHSHHPCDLHRDPNMGWRREDQIRGQGRSRERSPRERFQDQGRSQGRDRGGVEMHVPFEDRRREDLPREKSPHSDRYARDSEFRERPRLLDRPLEGFEGGPGDHWGTQGGFVREPCPLIVEHDHGMMTSGGPPRREPADDQRNRGPGRYRDSDRNLDYGREDPRHRVGSSQERFRKSNVREEGRGHSVHDARRSPINPVARRSPIKPVARRNPINPVARRSPINPVARRSPINPVARRSPIRHNERRSPINHDGIRNPVYPERSSPMGVQLGRNGPMGHRDRGSQGHRGRGSLAQRGRGNLSRGGRMETGPSRNQPHAQTFPGGRSHSPQEHQRPGFRSRDPAWDVNPRDEESDWVHPPKVPRLEPGRPRGAGRPPLDSRMGPGLSRERDLNPRWNPHKKVGDARVLKPDAVEEETLTIKVDMNRPMGQNSKLCYSSERQLSLDLVNVGRQRLDFLPMMEHSGTYRENSVHSGNFAQEIITLVHKVKEHYFRGDCVTLNERFSVPQKGGLRAEAKAEVEPERPTLNRRFNMNKMDPDVEPLFDAGHMQAAPRQRVVSDPGDLRHDLERRRQERLEGVKVTIPGGGLSQRPLEPSSELNEPDEGMDLDEEDEGFSGWRGDAGQGNRWDGHMLRDVGHQRKGGPFRPNTGAQRRSNRPPNRNRPGPMRRQNRNVDGVNW